MSVEMALVTAEEFEQIVAELVGPCELVCGEVREMMRGGAKHGGVCGRMSRLLGNWAESNDQGEVVTNDTGLVTRRNPDSVRGPDLFFIRWSTLPQGELPEKWLKVPPELCVEILSPSDRWKDVLDKITEYLDFGVKEVWVADPQLKQLHIYQPDSAPRVLNGDAAVNSSVLPGFECRVNEFFQQRRS